MKKALYPFFISLIISMLLISCATDRTIAQRITEFENSQANEPACYVQRNDGNFINYTTLKLVTGIFTSPHLLADGQIRINPVEIKAYQNQDHYAVSQKIFESGKHSAVAQETLPGFAIRVVKGKVNVYSKKFFNGQRAANEYYLQAGETGAIKLYTPELMNEMIKNDAAALEFFNNKNKKALMPEKMLVTVQLYNHDQLVSKN